MFKKISVLALFAVVCTCPTVAGQVAQAPASKTTESGLQYTDTKKGVGQTPKDGQIVIVHYTGTLPDGTKFDSSRDRGQPFRFTLGAGEVIKGWDEGIKTMKVGGQRQLIVPPELAYGSQGAGNAIPPNATLHFDVELIGVENGSGGTKGSDSKNS